VLGTAWILAAALALQAAAPPPAAPASRPPATTDDRPFQQLFQNLGKDLKRLPSTDSAGILAGGLAGAVALRRHDVAFSEWAIAEGPSSYTSVGAWLGDGWVQVGGAVGTYAVGLATHSHETTHIGSDLIRAQALNGVITRGLKIVAPRNRPSGGPHSLPSGHTSASFATAAVIQGHFGWKIGAPVYAAAGFVGWTRVRDDHHWLTDAVVGAAIGTMVGHTVTIGHRDHDTWTIVPVKSTGTLAIMFVRN
jgi:membrane-associated phospholipid phosphatase